ncbi:MAG: hypothetical protein COU69_02100 [Candidatus Pacebacteria bacterium CG10_big_fil_rev_8_21_14_0_10_56_10]|nr:MAG: hypothetical protein COU69_02100 [Candidatus Pacebacteria bacterium CG10_big_fil_rev_8_21_14_0_10_56_10]
MLKLTSLPTPDHSKLLAAAGRVLERQITSALESDGTLLLLSGGSNIALAQQLPAELFHHQRLTCLPLDERFSADPQLNNSLQLQAAGLPVAATVPSDDETLEMFATRFRLLLDAWLRRHPAGQVVAIIGVGADGHLAGISPFPDQPQRFERLFGGQQSVVGYEGNLQPAQRVTVTPHFLARLTAGTGLVTGENKLSMLERLNQQSSSIHVMPASLLHQLDAEVALFTDQPVADIVG